MRNANAAKRRLKYCTKIQNERQLLRQQEKELLIELAELQTMKSENQRIFERTKTMPVWQAIATRQLQSRLVAATRKKFLQELGEKVQQHLYGSNNTLQDGGAVEHAAPPIGPDDAALFDRYLQEVDVAYNQVDVYSTLGV